MYENYRKSFYRDDPQDYDDEFGEDRWRSETGRPTSYRGDRFAGPPEHIRRQGGGYRREEELRRTMAAGPDYGRTNRRGRMDRDRSEYWAHDPEHDHAGHGASSYGYAAGEPYRGEGDSRYFTGQQGSWAMRSPYGVGAGRGFGADYRDHGFASRHHHDHDERGFWDRATDEVASWFGDDDAAQRREMDHRGRGPKDYIRSDERIREDANDRLTEDPLIDATHIAVSVDQGEITLDGTVTSRSAKRRSEDLVDRVSGVKHVQNNLRVAENTTQASSTRAGWTAADTPEGGTISQPGRTTKI